MTDLDLTNELAALDEPAPPPLIVSSTDGLTVRRLDHRNADKDARAAFNMSALLLAPLPDGRFALCDRAQTLYLVVDQPPTGEEYKLYHRLLNITRMAAEATFYGEPNDKDLARDLKAASSPKRTLTQGNARRKPKFEPLDIEITL